MADEVKKLNELLEIEVEKVTALEQREKGLVKQLSLKESEGKENSIKSERAA